WSRQGAAEQAAREVPAPLMVAMAAAISPLERAAPLSVAARTVLWQLGQGEAAEAEDLILPEGAEELTPKEGLAEPAPVQAQVGVVAGDGSLTLNVNSGSAGTVKSPLVFEAGQLSVTGTGTGSAYLSDISGAQLNVAGITI